MITPRQLITIINKGDKCKIYFAGETTIKAGKETTRKYEMIFNVLGKDNPAGLMNQKPYTATKNIDPGKRFVNR